MSKTTNEMLHRMGTASAIAERVVGGFDNMDREEIRKEVFAILAYMNVDLDVHLTHDDIAKLYKETGHG